MTETTETYQRILQFGYSLRKTVLVLIAITFSCTLGFYFLSPQAFTYLQNHLNQDLVFYTVAEPFLAHVQLALCLALFVLAPVFITVFWKTLGNQFGIKGAAQVLFIVFTVILFFGGSCFCYFITLPYGIDFLLGFESEQLKPIIAISKFTTFVTLFILAFGFIFELPVFMIFASKTNMVPLKSFQQGRRYAVLVISIAAALLTPTPDVVNMMLMGVPLYLLYESGILLIRLFGFSQTTPEAKLPVT